ncbi:hypothetical protein LTR36_008564 [Oleoguttula mirabilis]|uniref:Uncharacterized protein n=1 Tax=Oleoguttula mirabilis TaxID=1507867 RepID=A0AAV9JSZ1_9PEZI|nr:hypothetical protein LTR36_008564 [Oleoguttula mirabilis]
MPRNLTINPAPFRSSNLAIPPSPFSPKLPFTPPASPPKRATSVERPKTNLELSPPPSEPLRWLWQCHICNRVYQLGVTRRCLDDGHLFCAGTTTVKRSRKTNKRVMRHKACASEFDYQGWKAWGTWRRDVNEQTELAYALAAADESDSESDFLFPLRVPVAPREGQWLSGAWPKKVAALKPTKDCWGRCDYPSECRWGKQYGVQTPVRPTATVPSSPPTSPLPAETPKTTFDDILFDASDSDVSSAEQLNQLAQQTTGTPEIMDEQTKKPSMDDLLESVKRRKRRSSGQLPSPLGSHPPSPTSSESPAAALTAEDEQSSADPAVVASASYLQKAFDDFELDVRKSLERAGGLVTSWASNIRSTAALEEERAEAFVKALRVVKKKGKTEGM